MLARQRPVKSLSSVCLFVCLSVRPSPSFLNPIVNEIFYGRSMNGGDYPLG